MRDDLNDYRRVWNNHAAKAASAASGAAGCTCCGGVAERPFAGVWRLAAPEGSKKMKTAAMAWRLLVYWRR